MDGIKRTEGDGSKAVQILQMTRDREMWQSMVGCQRLQGHGAAIT